MQRAVEQPPQSQGKSGEMDFKGRLGLDGSSEGPWDEMGSNFQGVGRKQNRSYHQEQGQCYSQALQSQKNIQNTLEYSSNSNQGYQAATCSPRQKGA